MSQSVSRRIIRNAREKMDGHRSPHGHGRVRRQPPHIRAALMGEMREAMQREYEMRLAREKAK